VPIKIYIYYAYEMRILYLVCLYKCENIRVCVEINLNVLKNNYSYYGNLLKTRHYELFVDIYGVGIRIVTKNLAQDNST